MNTESRTPVPNWEIWRFVLQRSNAAGMEVIHTDVLVVGGGTGGVAAAIQAARRGAQTVLVSEHTWLGGMLTASGVSAPDGNELLAFQTGIWGALLRSLQQQPQGLDHAWVSFFTYEPWVGAAIFADWVNALPNLRWISNQLPIEVQQQAETITGVRFADYWVKAKIILDATELGDVLALAEVPHLWGWEWQSRWQEPSAPVHPSLLTQTYVVQAPTWVFVLKDFETDTAAIQPVSAVSDCFVGTWDGYGAESFLSYGRLPGQQFMINWPQQGNDYGLQADRLIHSTAARTAFLQAAYDHAQNYAAFLQQQLGRRYGLSHAFPATNSIGGGAYALQPYYRESRRVVGIETVREQDILPLSGGQVAALPIDAAGQMNGVAIGNYANDHHYPGFELPLAAKSIRWGGRWTGTPFSLPYSCLVPKTTEGLLVCEKNISVSHIANGATRLQPTVLGIGQAAGMAAALCIEQSCQPRELPVRLLQLALLQEPTAPMAIVPLFNLPPAHPEWLNWQQYYLDHPEEYPLDGNAPVRLYQASPAQTSQTLTGWFQRESIQSYSFEGSIAGKPERLNLVTLDAEVDRQLQELNSGQKVQVIGRLNRSGNWFLVDSIAAKTA